MGKFRHCHPKAILLIFTCLLAVSYSKFGKNKWRYILAGDNQPLRYGSDSKRPDDNKKYNYQAAEYIKDLCNNNTCDFMMINGDLTEFGQDDQFDEYKNFKEKLNFVKLLYGLGNHDIENNIDDCTLVDNYIGPLGPNSCVQRMWMEMYYSIENFKKLDLPSFSTASNKLESCCQTILCLKYTTGVTGSLSYNFELFNNYDTNNGKGLGVKFYQLQNYESHYQVIGHNGRCFEIKPSIPEIYYNMIEHPDHYYILNAHYYKKTSNNPYSLNYIYDYIEKLNDRIIIMNQAHLHSPDLMKHNQFKSDILVAGALFYGEFFLVDLTLDDSNDRNVTINFDVKSCSYKENKTCENFYNKTMTMYNYPEDRLNAESVSSQNKQTKNLFRLKHFDNKIFLNNETIFEFDCNITLVHKINETNYNKINKIVGKTSNDNNVTLIPIPNYPSAQLVYQNKTRKVFDLSSPIIVMMTYDNSTETYYDDYEDISYFIC